GFFAVWNFNFLAVLSSDSLSRRKIAFIRQGRIVGFEEYDVQSLSERLAEDLHRFFDSPEESLASGSQYDEFCLVSNFIVDPLQSVDLIRVDEISTLPAQVVQRIHDRKRRRKTSEANSG